MLRGYDSIITMKFSTKLIDQSYKEEGLTDLEVADELLGQLAKMLEMTVTFSKGMTLTDEAIMRDGSVSMTSKVTNEEEHVVETVFVIVYNIDYPESVTEERRQAILDDMNKDMETIEYKVRVEKALRQATADCNKELANQVFINCYKVQCELQAIEG